MDNEVELTFDYNFQENQRVYFAYTYPWSYQQNNVFYSNLYNQLKYDDEIYFNKEVLIRSVENRNIDLITISSHGQKLEQQESHINPNLFPNYKTQPRSFRFKNNKPVILFTCRVHPGEVPASHALNGLVKFLTAKKDTRSQLILKHFVIMIVPMLNPDGVYKGYYRMDHLSQNLNRYYIDPDVSKQPSCFAVTKLVEYLNMEKRLFFFVDFHAHGQKKGCFFYGNNLDDFVNQVESQLFSKILSLNCVNFELESCNFSRKQMASKDKQENMTKEGCARVSVWKQTDIVHSYTLEMGFHQSNFLNNLVSCSNIHRKNKQYKYNEDNLESIHSDSYVKGKYFYTVPIFENLGKNLVISILDIFNKNIYSRIINCPGKTIQNVRKEVCFIVLKQDTQHKIKDNKLQQKIKNINELVEKQVYHHFNSLKVFDQEKSFNVKRPNKIQIRTLNKNNTTSIKSTLTKVKKNNFLLFKNSNNTILHPENIQNKSLPQKKVFSTSQRGYKIVKLKTIHDKQEYETNKKRGKTRK